jgi:hypothetical protein
MTAYTTKLARRSIVAVASLTLGVGAICSLTAHADDKMSDDKKMMPMSAEDQKMCMDCMAKMKEMAADPKESEKMTKEVAEMMVMEHMAKSMAMDPQFQKSTMEAMNDPAMKNIHEDAEKMAQDPDQMKSMQQMVMSDPKKMEMVERHAMMMVMMHDKMDGGKMDDKMGK